MKRQKNLLYLTLILAMLLILSAGCTTGDDGSADGELNDNLPDSSASDISASDDSADYAAFSYSDGIDENGFFEGVTALDYVEDLHYQGLPIPGAVHQISQDNVEAEVSNILSNYTSSEKITSRAIVDGDTVNIDYVGSVDGVAFDGGSTMGAGTDVTIGVTSYIDDFLEQLIGHTPGETINVEVTFPDVYQEQSLQGKDAVFVTTVNYIVETKQPELTDDFVKTNLSDSHDWETVAAMKEGISEQLQKAAIQKYISEYLTNEVSTRLVPDQLTDYQEKAMLRYYLDGAEYYGIGFEEFLNSYVGVSDVDELIEKSRSSTLQSATYALVAQAVAEDAKIVVSEDDIINYIADYSKYEEQYGLPYLKQLALFQKVVDYIADNSVLE